MVAARRCAGSWKVCGVGWMTVPYETAIERTRDNEEDSAAPTVPLESANAAVRTGSEKNAKRMCVRMLHTRRVATQIWPRHLCVDTSVP